MSVLLIVFLVGLPEPDKWCFMEQMLIALNSLFSNS